MRKSGPPQTAILARLRRAIRPVQNPMLPAVTINHLRELRLEELKTVLGLVQSRGRLLEVGAGLGWQAAALAAVGFDVEAIDVAPVAAAGLSAWPVKRYDGRLIPFEDACFDVTFSSNTLEHIPDRDGFQKEIRRVLKDDGLAIHIVPSATWRIWTNLAFPLRYFFVPIKHGEHAANAWTEIVEFREAAWRRVFIANGWDVVHSEPTGLFYTGCSLADARLPVERRRILGRYLGSACHVFALKKARAKKEDVSRKSAAIEGEQRR